MWEPCRVFSYDANSNKFRIQWCDRDEEAELLRIELLFKVSRSCFFLIQCIPLIRYYCGNVNHGNKQKTKIFAFAHVIRTKTPSSLLTGCKQHTSQGSSSQNLFCIFPFFWNDVSYWKKGNNIESKAFCIIKPFLRSRYRAVAESLIQYNYYIDNMPTSDIPGLGA